MQSPAWPRAIISDSHQHVTWNSSEATPLSGETGGHAEATQRNVPVVLPTPYYLARVISPAPPSYGARVCTAGSLRVAAVTERAAGIDCAHAMVHKQPHLQVALVRMLLVQTQASELQAEGATWCLQQPVRRPAEDCTGWGSGDGVPGALVQS